MPSVDYRPVVENHYRRTFCKDATGLVDWAKQPFEAGIIRQLRAIGVAQPQQRQNIDLINLIKREKHLISKAKLFDPSKKLNDMKINMVYLEWYKKSSENEKTGYYDSYKEKKGTCDFNVEMFKKRPTLYWIDMVKELENKPQKEGASLRSLRTCWLGAGTTCRRTVEPLDVAEYYKENKLKYETQGRSDHYIRLEEWLKEANNLESKQTR